MTVSSIPDLSLPDCLELMAGHFDLRAIAETPIDQASVTDYDRQSDRGYRLFHSQEGAMHVALNRHETFTTDGYLGQVELIAAGFSVMGQTNLFAEISHSPARF